MRTSSIISRREEEEGLNLRPQRRPCRQYAIKGVLGLFMLPGYFSGI